MTVAGTTSYAGSKMGLFRRLVLRGGLLIGALSVLLASASVILSRRDADDVCLSLSDYGGIARQYYIDTAYGRVHELPRPTGFSNFGAISSDERYSSYFNVRADQTMDLLLAEYPGDDQPVTTTVIRSNIRSETPTDSANHVLWSPDNRAFAYLWRDLDGQLYLSVYNRAEQREQTIPYTLRGDTSFFNGVQITGWSGDSRAFALQERTGGALYFRFYTTDPLALMETELDELPLYFGSWSPVGAQFAAADLGTAESSTLYLHDWNAPLRALPLDIPRRNVQGVYWSPDGRYFTLISYMSDCVGAACDLYWRFDLYGRDGTLIAGNLSGLHTVPADQTDRIVMGMWQDEHRWLWAEQPTANARVDLVTLDVISGARTTLVSNLLDNHVADMFYFSPQRWLYVLPNSTSPPNIPENDWLLVPWQNGDEVHVDLLNVATGELTPIVSHAEAVLGTTDFSGTGFWDWSGQRAIIIWSRGQPPERQTYLSVLNLADNSVHTTTDAATHIHSVSWISDTLIGFVRQTENAYALDMLDTGTGAQHHLLDLTNSSRQWSGTLRPSGDQLAINIQGSNPTGSTYLIPLDGSEQSVLSDRTTSSMLWSPDGSRLVFIEYTRTYPRVVIAAPDGTRLGVIPVRTIPSTASIWLGGWSRCDPPGL